MHAVGGIIDTLVRATRTNTAEPTTARGLPRRMPAVGGITVSLRRMAAVGSVNAEPTTARGIPRKDAEPTTAGTMPGRQSTLTVSHPQPNTRPVSHALIDHQPSFDALEK